MVVHILLLTRFATDEKHAPHSLTLPPLQHFTASMVLNYEKD